MPPPSLAERFPIESIRTEKMSSSAFGEQRAYKHFSVDAGSNGSVSHIGQFATGIEGLNWSCV